MTFDLLLPAQVVFGWGSRSQLGQLAAAHGQRAILVHGSNTLRSLGVVDEIIASLTASGLEVIDLPVASREPTIADVDDATRQLLAHRPRPGDVIIGLGGGSSIDLAKGVAAMATNARGRSVREFLEGVGTGATLTASPLPVIALPTTAGTGSEATKNAVISVDDPPCKKSLRSNQLVPRVALIDPELTVSNPPHVTAASGMDAITQLIESYLSCRAQPVPQALAIDGLRRALPAIVAAVKIPHDRAAREAMAYAAFLSGVALANSGLGMAHGVAAALGSISQVSHGLACATMLPIALEVNLEVCTAQVAQLARALSPDTIETDEQAASRFISTIRKLLEELQIPTRLRELGVRQADIPQLAAGSQGNSLNGNPRPLTPQDLETILAHAW